jgi:hypothetical protein
MSRPQHRPPHTLAPTCATPPPAGPNPPPNCCWPHINATRCDERGVLVCRCRVFVRRPRRPENEKRRPAADAPRSPFSRGPSVQPRRHALRHPAEIIMRLGHVQSARLMELIYGRRRGAKRYQTRDSRQAISAYFFIFCTRNHTALTASAAWRSRPAHSASRTRPAAARQSTRAARAWPV